MNEPAVRTQGLGKCYRVSHASSPRAALGRALRRWRRRDADAAAEGEAGDFWALRDVSFDVGRGEVVGIIGRNGAGKSTLLKILSRVTAPTTGEVRIRGRVGSLLEVGTGFHPDLSGRENVFLNGVIIGMKRSQVAEHFDEIVGFAELEKFIDEPVKHYSSGMYMRLAFAVAAHLDVEVMIVDEVLAVGDAAFQRRCLGKMDDVAKAGRTVLFVSHSMPAVRSLCSRALLFENGSIAADGSADAIADLYAVQAFGEPSDAVTLPEDPMLRVQVLHAELRPPVETPAGPVVPFRCNYVVRSELPDLLFCIDVRNGADVSVFYANDESLTEPRKRKPGLHHLSCQIPQYLLAPGDYRVLFGFWEPGHPPEHFPDVCLGFKRHEPGSRLAAHHVAWPSVICLPTTWSYDAA